VGELRGGAQLFGLATQSPGTRLISAADPGGSYSPALQ
jgi:hypothetical protein